MKFISDEFGKWDRQKMYGYPLTRREHQVCAQMASGLQNKEIARVLCITEGTVKCHLAAAMIKWGCRNRVEMAIEYIKQLALIREHASAD